MDPLPSPAPARQNQFRRARTFLLCLAGFITVVAIFFTIENWRGHRAWEKCKRKLEAKGEVLDWNDYIPPPVPNDQNIFKAPKMTEWFVGRDTNELSERLSISTLSKFAHQRNVIAEVTVVPAEASVAADQADLFLRFNGSVLTGMTDSGDAVGKQLKKLVQDAAGQMANQISGPRLKGAQGFMLFAARFDPIKPARILVQADRIPKPAEVARFLPSRADTVAEEGPFSVRVEPAGTNSFRVTWNPDVYPAVDYLEWSEKMEPELEIIRSALRRPYARIDTDYSQRIAMTNVNFVMLRTLTQTMAQRAQCHLLLAQPDKALEDLTLVHQLSRLLEARPTGQPMTLVAAMINVAITGLYVDTIADGLRLKAWQEPQLAALQAQLEEVSLSPFVRDAFRAERASMCRLLETTPPPQLARLFLINTPEPGTWRKIKDPRYLLLTLAPHGWIYQNMAATALLEQNAIESFDPANALVIPHKASAGSLALRQEFKHRSPYSYLAARIIPNLIRAIQRDARAQTLANEAFTACALERYRLAHDQYPETLDALVPLLAKKLPLDIDRGPLRYQRVADGEFLLYSIGWNEQDDGGRIVYDKNGATSLDDGDWVWSPPPR